MNKVHLSYLLYSTVLNQKLNDDHYREEKVKDTHSIETS